jgi:mono/diheme cytochrome c family protein
MQSFVHGCVKVFLCMLLVVRVVGSLAHGQQVDKKGEPQAPSVPTERTGSAPPLAPEEQKRFEAGKTVYEMTCLACHQPHGLGQEALAPPLVGSEWVTNSPQRLVRIVIHGMRGPIKVKGQVFELDMPALAVLDDEQIAAVLTYVRREWGHAASPVNTATVKKIREATANREDAWTEAELLKIE